MRTLGTTLVALVALAAAPAGADRAADDPNSGAALIGTPAPAWTFTRWVRGGPLALEDLRGRVVLLRWWTEGCRFCETTLPVIEAARTRHADDGLVVVGVFHPKPPRELADRRIRALADRLGYGGAIALDRDWRTLERWWLDGHPERAWTSVSFLIGRDGAIRWVHGGGEYHGGDDPRHARCAVDHEGFLAALSAALAEPAAAAP